MQYTGIRYGKPPLASLSFDVRLRNPHSEPRWFLLPELLAQWQEIAKSGGVNRADIYDYGPEGNPQVRLGSFSGNGGFRAILLPPGADISIHGFAITATNDLRSAKHISVSVVIAREVKIGDENAESWFRGNALSAKGAEIKNDDGRKSSSHSSADGKELKVTLVGEERFTVDVPITRGR
jgi:hypothetical protein